MPSSQQHLTKNRATPKPRGRNCRGVREVRNETIIILSKFATPTGPRPNCQSDVVPLNNKIPPAAAGYPSIDWLNDASTPTSTRIARERERKSKRERSECLAEILQRSSLSLSLIRLCCVYAECVSAESTLHPNTLIGVSSGPRRARSQTDGQGVRTVCDGAEGGLISIQDDAFTKSVLCVRRRVVLLVLRSPFSRAGECRVCGCTNTKPNNRNSVVCAYSLAADKLLFPAPQHLRQVLWVLCAQTTNERTTDRQTDSQTEGDWEGRGWMVAQSFRFWGGSGGG